MPIVTFRRAQRRATHVIITAYGESGCGKTLSLIKLGRGLVGPQGKLGMLDTETGRGLIYAETGGGYEYGELTPPFTPERYVEAIDAAEEAGFDALILDSGSHEWEGLGGILEIAEESGQRGLVKWAAPKARHKRYVHRLLQSRMHLLISLRGKEKMVQLTYPPFPPGKKSGDIISAGYVPIQDKRFVYETTVQLFLPVYTDRKMLGVPVLEKCPEDLLGAFPDGEHITEETGRKIAEWVAGGEPVNHADELTRKHASDAAADGTEAFRTFWKAASAAQREVLRPGLANLQSIAEEADAAQERARETARENEERNDPNLDDPFGGKGITHTGGAHLERDDAFGLPPIPADTASPPTGERPGEDSANEPRTPQPPRQGDHSAPVVQRSERAAHNGDVAGSSPAGRTTEIRGNDATARSPASDQPQEREVTNGLAANATPAGERKDLLGDAPAENLFVPLTDDLDYYARQMLAMIAERPNDRQRNAQIRRANENGIGKLKAARSLIEQYDELQAALAGGS